MRNPGLCLWPFWLKPFLCASGVKKHSSPIFLRWPPEPVVPTVVGGAWFTRRLPARPRAGAPEDGLQIYGRARAAKQGCKAKRLGMSHSSAAASAGGAAAWLSEADIDKIAGRVAQIMLGTRATPASAPPEGPPNLQGTAGQEHSAAPSHEATWSVVDEWTTHDPWRDEARKVEQTATATKTASDVFESAFLKTPDGGRRGDGDDGGGGRGGGDGGDVDDDGQRRRRRWRR